MCKTEAQRESCPPPWGALCANWHSWARKTSTAPDESTPSLAAPGVVRSCQTHSGLWNSCQEQTLSISGAAFLLGRRQQCFPTSRQQSDWWSPWRAGLQGLLHTSNRGRTAAGVSRCNPFTAVSDSCFPLRLPSFQEQILLLLPLELAILFQNNRIT